MKYKAIFIDIDGTLLNPHHEITDKTKEAIMHLSQTDLKIVLATGRPLKATGYIRKELDLVANPHICFNGSLVIENGDVLFNSFVPNHFLEKISSITSENNLSLCFYDAENCFVEKTDPRIEEEMEITKMHCIEKPIPEMIDFWNTRNSGANKLLAMGEMTDIENAQAHLTASGFQNLSFIKSNPHHIEVIKQDSTKDHAVRFLTKKFGLPASEIIAVGDNFNDLEMLKFAGLGVAMGNAPEQVQNAADRTIDTNENEGLAQFIFELL